MESKILIHRGRAECLGGLGVAAISSIVVVGRKSTTALHKFSSIELCSDRKEQYPEMLIKANALQEPERNFAPLCSIRYFMFQRTLQNCVLEPIRRFFRPSC